MKHTGILLIVSAFLASCSGLEKMSKQNYDDTYFSLAEKRPGVKAAPSTPEYSPETERRSLQDEATQGSSAGATNSYADRFRRFGYSYNPSPGNCYSCGSQWNSSIYGGWNSWNGPYTGYSLSYGNPWVNSWNNPWNNYYNYGYGYGYGYNSWYNPWGYNPYSFGYNPWNTYQQGYYHGYYQGAQQGGYQHKPAIYQRRNTGNYTTPNAPANRGDINSPNRTAPAGGGSDAPATRKRNDNPPSQTPPPTNGSSPGTRGGGWNNAPSASPAPSNGGGSWSAPSSRGGSGSSGSGSSGGSGTRRR